MKQINLKYLALFGIVSVLGLDATNVFGAVANKSSTFSTQLDQQAEESETEDSALAASINAQRAALDRVNTETTTRAKSSSTRNICDETLQKCMTTKCGTDYSKCATDSEIIFSDKLTACNKDKACTAHEFDLFVNEIKEDRKQAIRLANYNLVIECGKKYNACIIEECGDKFNKCLGKAAGDKALANCKSIATQCTEADSGMPGRIGSIFGIVRQDAEIQIKSDEKRLTSLRDQMRKSCEGLGAMFDDRSLDCVFTVNFTAGTDDKQFDASRKLYAGSVFDCTPDWFGIDVTTFKENAYRLTRSQSGASSAMLGSGVGMAVGALTSGAIDRAIASKQAKDELKDACADAGYGYKDGKCIDPKTGRPVDATKTDGTNPTTPTTTTGTGTGDSAQTGTSGGDQGDANMETAGGGNEQTMAGTKAPATATVSDGNGDSGAEAQMKQLMRQGSEAKIKGSMNADAAVNTTLTPINDECRSPRNDIYECAFAYYGNNKVAYTTCCTFDQSAADTNRLSQMCGNVQTKSILTQEDANSEYRKRVYESVCAAQYSQSSSSVQEQSTGNDKADEKPCTKADFDSSSNTQNATEGWYINGKCVAKACKNGFHVAKGGRGESLGYCVQNKTNTKKTSTQP